MKIIIIGIMGVGKTTVSEELSKISKIDFIDMDKQIELEEGCSISNIFNKHGEDYFRKLENKMLEKIINSKKDIIISTGGGIVVTKENNKILKENKTVVFLDANEDTIMEHLKNGINERPLLKNSENPKDKIRELLDNRYKKYVDVADIILDVNGKNINEVVNEINDLILNKCIK